MNCDLRANARFFVSLATKLWYSLSRYMQNTLSDIPQNVLTAPTSDFVFSFIHSINYYALCVYVSVARARVMLCRVTLYICRTLTSTKRFTIQNQRALFSRHLRYGVSGMSTPTALYTHINTQLHIIPVSFYTKQLCNLSHWHSNLPTKINGASYKKLLCGT